MLRELPIQWFVWACVFYIALRSLISMSILLRDRLQGLLVEHVRRQQVESQKRQRIKELREKIRAKKANQASAEARQQEARKDNEKKAA